MEIMSPDNTREKIHVKRGKSLEEMRRFCPVATEEVFVHLALEKVVDRRTSLGGVSRSQVLAEIERAALRLEG